MADALAGYSERELLASAGAGDFLHEKADCLVLR